MKITKDTRLDMFWDKKIKKKATSYTHKNSSRLKHPFTHKPAIIYSFDVRKQEVTKV